MELLVEGFDAETCAWKQGRLKEIREQDYVIDSGDCEILSQKVRPIPKIGLTKKSYQIGE